MTEAKHTPGPWEWAEKETRFTVLPSRKPSNWQGPRNICERISYRGSSHWEEHRANARLIAAAPEMLEALERLESVVRLNVAFEYEACVGAVDEARAAIAKARGEAP